MMNLWVELRFDNPLSFNQRFNNKPSTSANMFDIGRRRLCSLGSSSYYPSLSLRESLWITLDLHRRKKLPCVVNSLVMAQRCPSMELFKIVI